MMAGKAALFGDAETAERIRQAPHPWAAKALGFDLVVAGNVAKFGQHPQLRQFLLATGQRVLVEASPLDRIWGSGWPPMMSGPPGRRPWQGLNLLGSALMEVCHQLAAATGSQQTAAG